MNKEIQDIDNEMTDKMIEAGDNPWLSEALRSRKIKAIQDKYSGQKEALINRLQLDQSLLESGREEAKFVAQQGLQISHWEQEQDQALMLKAIDWAEKEDEAKRKLTGYDSSDYKEIQGGLYDIKNQNWVVAPQAGKISSGKSSGGYSMVINPAGQKISMSPEAKAILNGTLRLEDLTPTVKGKIAGELNAAGYKSLPKLSTSQQEDISTMGTVKNMIDEIVRFNADGKLEGIGAFKTGSLKSLLAQAGIGSEEGKSVRALIGNIKGTIAKLRGGTSFTPNEEKLLETYTPSINDNASVAINKLSLLKTYIDQKESNIRNTAIERILPSSQSFTADELINKYK